MTRLYLFPPPSPLIDMADACIGPDLLTQSASASASMQSIHQNKCKAAELANEISTMPKRGKTITPIAPK